MTSLSGDVATKNTMHESSYKTQTFSAPFLIFKTWFWIKAFNGDHRWVLGVGSSPQLRKSHTGGTHWWQKLVKHYQWAIYIRLAHVFFSNTNSFKTSYCFSFNVMSLKLRISCPKFIVSWNKSILALSTILIKAWDCAEGPDVRELRTEKNWSRPEVSIHGAAQIGHSLWGRECSILELWTQYSMNRRFGA